MTDGNPAPIRRINPPELDTPPGFSQVVEVRASRIVFIAGQTALDRHGALVGKNDFAAQADQVFRNLTVALQSAGCTASNLVKLTVFLRDMDHLANLSRGTQPLLCLGHAAGRARRHAGRSVEALRTGLPDRDRGHCGALSGYFLRRAGGLRFAMARGAKFLRSAMANERVAHAASSLGSS